MYNAVPILADAFVTVELTSCSWVQGQGLRQSSSQRQSPATRHVKPFDRNPKSKTSRTLESPKSTMTTFPVTSSNTMFPARAHGSKEVQKGLTCDETRHVFHLGPSDDPGVIWGQRSAGLHQKGMGQGCEGLIMAGYLNQSRRGDSVDQYQA